MTSCVGGYVDVHIHYVSACSGLCTQVPFQLRFMRQNPMNQNNSILLSVHYNDVMMGTIASRITSLTIVYSTFYSDAYQRKLQSSVSLAFVRGLHRGPVNSPHKWPVTRKRFPFDDFIMLLQHTESNGMNISSSALSVGVIPFWNKSSRKHFVIFKVNSFAKIFSSDVRTIRYYTMLGFWKILMPFLTRDIMFFSVQVSFSLKTISYLLLCRLNAKHISDHCDYNLQHK